MCHECGDDNEEVEFSSSFVDELQTMPSDMREEIIADMQESIAYVMERAEQHGFLFELITELPRQKVAVFEAAVVMEKNILDDGHNH